MFVYVCVDVVSEQKRVRLLMQVFHSTDIVRDESVAVVKFRVWWHYVIALKDKATALFAEVLSSLCCTPWVIKICNFVFDYKSGVSWSIYTICTIGNTKEYYTEELTKFTTSY